MDATDHPLIVLADRTVLLETSHPRSDEARGRLGTFAELVKSPEHVQTFRISPLSLWNAAAAGQTSEDVIAFLSGFARYGVPGNVAAEIRQTMERYGRIELVRSRSGTEDVLDLVSQDAAILQELATSRAMTPLVLGRVRDALHIRARTRGSAKKTLLDMGFPVRDLAGFSEGEPLDIRLRDATATGEGLVLRDYQSAAVAAFHQAGSDAGGHGVVALPCGSGKTLVGLAAMAEVGRTTLIVCSSTLSARQWAREILDKTTATPDMVGEYTGASKEIRPVTIATYQVLTWRASKGSDVMPHMDLFRKRDWGLVIYDEVHLLPAPVFRATAEIQSKRRLGLTATLVREDGLEGDVFSLIGPKRYDAPWRDLERAGWIAQASCSEIRLALSSDQRATYAAAPDRLKYGIAAQNPVKLDVVEALVRSLPGEPTLVIGQYVDQLKTAARRLNAPLITGDTPQRDRESLFADFRSGAIGLLVVSKVANYSIDLPEASVAIQVSGTFGSRQEEAQRLGRILRPKRSGGPARFYSIVTRETVDEDFNAKRQLFLVEQGYRYEIADWETIQPTLSRLEVVTQ